MNDAAPAIDPISAEPAIDDPSGERSSQSACGVDLVACDAP